MKILIIEDNEFVQRAYRRLLKQHELSLAESVEEAIAILKVATYDVIVCDGDLKGAEDGWDLWLWINKNLPNMVSKFIFNSSDLTIEQKCLQDGIPYHDKSDHKVLVALINSKQERPS